MIESLADQGYVSGSASGSATCSATIKRLRADWSEFATRNGLESIVVVNAASTEPPLDAKSIPQSWAELESKLDDPDFAVPPSVVYAIAAIGAGHQFVNFTPSTGSNLDAVRELALQRGVCHAGRDGKTGETLLKSVLAPMFARRNLEVMSWVGHNIFGNMDGQVLNDPSNKATKVASKDKLLGEILGYPPQTHVSIEYIRSLGDWKTAWDHIHFRGFLGTPMTMQFTWQGCDSILAAPLVLDLARFVELAARRGEAGELGFLASFFKSPQGCSTHDFGKQFDLLCNWVN
jgi:myo-inositol-1-phosphate synthase